MPLRTPSSRCKNNIKMHHIGGLTAINTNNSMVLWSCSSSALKVESRSSSKQGLVSNKTLRFLLLNCAVKMSLTTMYSSDTVNGRVVGCCDHDDEQLVPYMERVSALDEKLWASQNVLCWELDTWNNKVICMEKGKGLESKQLCLFKIYASFKGASALLGPRPPHCWVW